ncbi:putative variant erythrocyte surface antigen-1, partial [Babesia divergens]
MSQHKSLLVCPKNLKECIDWVLRATGKDNGSNDIDKLKDALNVELKGSVKSNDLTQLETQLTELASGLGFLAGLPACLCKTKESVEKGLQKIYEELNKNILLIKCDISQLNCDSCKSNDVPCKCCVIQSINKVKGSCGCLKNPKQKCHCAGQKVSCNKVLAGLEACLHLQCLQSDMNEICECKADDTCCKTGQCNNGSCPFCKNLQTKTPVPTTGLGLSPPNPIRLAQRLEKFFGDSSSKSSGCSCKGSPCTCCCLACPDNQCAQACSCSGSGKCAHTPQHSPQGCPRKKFCKAIQNVKVLANSSEMTCCEGGKKCHCELQGSGSNCTPNCCVVEDTSGAGSNNHYQHSVKCMLRRVVKFFASFDPSKKDCPKLCCEIFCVLKCCVFLRDFYDKGGKKCSMCTSKGSSGKPCPGSTLKSPAPSNNCCGGKPSACKSSDCCLGCQDCDAIKFSRALQKLQYSGPCGLDLYRLLDGLLNFIRNVMAPNQNFIRNTVLAAVNSCSNCKKSETDSSKWQACECSKNSGSCLACTSLLQDSKLMSILRHGYSSAYSSATWPSSSPSTSGSKCCGSSSSSCTCPSSCSSSRPCDPKNCCDACPQRKAAKIFLGMVPCLYYGLKILHARSKYGSGFAGWHDISMNSNDKPSSDLAKFFYAWGYDLRPLISKKGTEFFSLLENLFGSDSSGPLQKLSTLVTENYFTSNLISPSSDPSKPSHPKTVREMLLWLYGLPFTSGFHDLVSHCSSLCSPFGNSFNSDAFCYYIYTCCFLLPVAIISLIEDSSSAQKVFSSSSDWTSFSYPEDLSSLFEKLCEYARKIFVA